MAKKNGGPAFGHGNPEHGGDPGMSLRDWFAGQALAIVHKRFESEGAPSLEDIAMQAYFIADAMLDERETEDWDG